MTLGPRPVWTPAWAALLAALVVVSSLIALTTRPEGSMTSTWWPSVGFAVAALALSPRRWWPALSFVVAGSTVLTGVVNDSAPAPFIAAFTVACVLEALAGASVLRFRRTPDEVRLSTPADAVRIGLAALTASVVSSLSATLFVWLEGSRPVETIFRSLMPSHLASALVVLLLVLSWRSPRRRISLVELVLQLTLLGVALWVIFWTEQHPALSPVPLLLLIWAAYRFGVRVLAWQIFAATASIGLATATGHGPFRTLDGVALDPQVVATLTQTYVVCAVLICLPVAIAVHTSDLLARQLRASHDLSDITLSTTACIMLVTDIHGQVLRANPAVTSVLGHDVDSVVGLPLWQTIPSPADRETVRRYFASGDGRGIPRQLEARVEDAQGRLRRIVWTSGIVHDEGRPGYVVLTGLDVTAERTASGLMEHLLSAALDTAIIGTDPEGTVTLFNTGAQALLGRPADHAIGTPFTSLLDDRGLVRWAASHQTSARFDSLVTHLAGLPPQDWEWSTSPAPDSPSRRVSMSLTRVTDHSNALIGYLCIGQDVTEIHATAELLVNALETERQVVRHLKDLDTAKDHFVSTVSHELRTPVATIVGYGEMLADGDIGELSPAQSKALGAIVRNGERLVDLVDNLLALGELSASGPRWDRDPVDLREVVREVQVDTAELTQDRVLTVEFTVPDTRVPVVGERATLLLALNNLVNNAVKFTDDGHVRCVLDVLDDRARVVVEDTGLGIPTEEQGHLFERFWRSSTSQQREIQGTGLGLSTAQTIVRAHDGELRIDSVEGRGTTVVLLLPLHQEGRSRNGQDDELRRG